MLRSPALPLRYQSGEEVLAGDRISYHSEPGEIKFVASVEDPETRWYVEEYGGGCMLQVLSFGSVFVSDPQADEDLEFVARAGT